MVENNEHPREPFSRMLWRRTARKLQLYRHNPFVDLRRFVHLKWGEGAVADLYPYERHVWSQHGEDGVLEAIFMQIGATHKYFVEFGAGHGGECNTAYLARRGGWTGLLMDAVESPGESGVKVHREFITAENINALFEKYKVPSSFDLLSIDLDGNDYWVWRSMAFSYRPRVIVIEYNASIPPGESRVIEYDPNFSWNGSDYYGASLSALEKLGRSKGYSLIYCESSGVNAFFVEDSLVEGHFMRREVSEVYRPPLYGDNYMGWPRDKSRTMMAV